MRVLLAGGGGFIGSSLFSCFQNAYNVESIDTNATSSRPNSCGLDLTNREQVSNFAKAHDKYEVLVFLVGLAHEKGKDKELPVFRSVNYQTLVNLLDAFAHEKKIPEKIIFSSTISVYGERKSQKVYDEASPTTPYSPYAVTKLMAEQYLLSNYPEKSWILRFAPVYAPNFPLNINRRVRLGRWLYKVGNGSTRLSLCNIDNIQRVIGQIINGVIPVSVYNISDQAHYSYMDLIEHQGRAATITIPRILIQLSYLIGVIFGNIFLKENSIKLITDNVYPSDKISSFVDLSSNLRETKFVSDH